MSLFRCTRSGEHFILYNSAQSGVLLTKVAGACRPLAHDLHLEARLHVLGNLGRVFLRYHLVKRLSNISRDETYLGKYLPQLRRPGVERLEEHTISRVALATFYESLPTAILEGLIDQLGDALEGTHPIVMAASEHSVA